MCVKDCVSNAIDEETKKIDGDRCSLCSHCLSICPAGAVSIDNIKPEPLRKLPEDMAGIFEDLVFKRRSVRIYKDIPISEEIINKIIDLTRYAPTGTNSQKVYITVINSKEKIKYFSDMVMKFFTNLSGLLNPVFLPIVKLFLGSAKTNTIYGYKDYLKKYWEGKNILTYDAPCLFIFHAPKNSSTPEQDGVIWATTALYYTETLGIGTCFNGFLVRALNAKSKFKRHLSIPKNHTVLETFTAGYPVYSYKNRAVREKAKVNIIK